MITTGLNTSFFVIRAVSGVSRNTVGSTKKPLVVVEGSCGREGIMVGRDGHSHCHGVEACHSSLFSRRYASFFKWTLRLAAPIADKAGNATFAAATAASVP